METYNKNNISYLNDNMSGIYVLYSETKKIIYIGESEDIKKRLNQHINNNEWEDAIYFDYLIINSKEDRMNSEKNYIQKYNPKHNELFTH